MGDDRHRAQGRVVRQRDSDRRRQAELALALVQKDVDIVDFGSRQADRLQEGLLQGGGPEEIQQSLQPQQRGSHGAAACRQTTQKVASRRSRYAQAVQRGGLTSLVFLLAQRFDMGSIFNGLSILQAALVDRENHISITDADRVIRGKDG